MEPEKMVGARRGIVRRLVLLALALAAPLASGCWYAEISRGDLAKTGIKFEGAPLPITAAVDSFKFEKSGKEAEAIQFIISKSFLTALDETRMFQGVYTEAEAPDSEVRFQGTVKKVSIYQNDWWILLIGATAVATFGIFPGVGLLLGLPYSSEHGTMRFEVRATDRRSGSLIATYDIDWDDSWFLNIYNSGEHQDESFFLQPKRASQAAMNEALGEITRDVERYRSVKPNPPAQDEAPPEPPAPPASPPGGAPEAPR